MQPSENFGVIKSLRADMVHVEVLDFDHMRHEVSVPVLGNEWDFAVGRVLGVIPEAGDALKLEEGGVIIFGVPKDNPYKLKGHKILIAKQVVYALVSTPQEVPEPPTVKPAPTMFQVPNTIEAASTNADLEIEEDIVTTPVPLVKSEDEAAVEDSPLSVIEELPPLPLIEPSEVGIVRREGDWDTDCKHTKQEVLSFNFKKKGFSIFLFRWEVVEGKVQRGADQYRIKAVRTSFDKAWRVANELIRWLRAGKDTSKMQKNIDVDTKKWTDWLLEREAERACQNAYK